MYKIHFGTSGWRDIIADGFTFQGVTALTRAVARNLKKRKLAGKGVLVGHDPRFLAEEFTRLAAAVLSEEGIKVYMVEEVAPTPVLAAAIIDLKLAGGVNFTASHNSAIYQGYKWSNSFGGPATKEEVAPIEAEANRLLAMGGGRAPIGIKKGAIILYDPKPKYFKRLEKMIPLSVLRKAHLNVVADPLYGAGRGYLDKALQDAGCKITVLHDFRDTLFGGHAPEPNAEYMAAAALMMKKRRAVLALGTDGDADRFGVVDRDGTYMTANEVLALTVYLLVHHRKLEGRVVRSVVTSHLVDAVAKLFGLPVEVTPVGFKYIGESMRRNGFLAGGEESGGLTIAGHVPEKDGMLACLLMAELVAREKKSLKAILRSLFTKVGVYKTGRINVRLKTKASGKKLQDYLADFHPKLIAGLKVTHTDRTDGFKFIMEHNAWMGIRLSGTEPVARLYLEADADRTLQQLAREGRKLLEAL